MNSVSSSATALRNSLISNFSHALHAPLEAVDSPGGTLDTPSPGAEEMRSGGVTLHGGVGSIVAPPTDSKRLTRRVMPARLRRVSSLLTGSIIEEEMAGAAAKDAEPSGHFRGSTSVILTTADIASTPVIHNTAEPAAILAVGGPREQIETPEFRTRDDTEVMGKTRSMRSQEDTSDAAYERRHRKADNAEKRLRRWEKENLKKDRQKILERMEHLKHADVRALAPILTVREQRDRQHSSADGANVATATSEGTDVTAQQAKLEHLRDELVDECKSVLRRYDALLTVPVDEVPPPITYVGKRKKPRDDDGGHTSSAASAGEDADAPYRPPRRTISVSGAFARKGGSSSVTGGGAGNKAAALKASGSALRASSSTSALPDNTTREKKPNTKYSARDIKAKRLSLERTPRPFTDEDGNLRAEHTYANIHARTSGGRFAPKVALGAIPGAAPASRSKINTKTGRAKAATTSTGASEVPQQRKKGRPRKSEGATASTSTFTATTASTPARRPRGRPPKSPVTTSVEASHDGVRTRRVKLILNRNGGGKATSDATSKTTPSSTTSSSISTPGSLSPAEHVKDEDDGDQSGTAMLIDKRDADGDTSMDSEGELDAALPASSTPARSALTLEEAQALLMKAMADGDDEDAMDAAAAAAATMIPPHGR